MGRFREECRLSIEEYLYNLYVAMIRAHVGQETWNMRPTRTIAMKAKERSCTRLNGLALETLCARYRLASSMMGGRDFEGDGALSPVMDVVLAKKEMGESHTWRGWFNVSVTNEGLKISALGPWLVLQVCPNNKAAWPCFLGDDGRNRVRDDLQVRFNVSSTTSSCPSCAGSAIDGSFGQLAIGRHDRWLAARDPRFGRLENWESRKRDN